MLPVLLVCLTGTRARAANPYDLDEAAKPASVVKLEAELEEERLALDRARIALDVERAVLKMARSEFEFEQSEFLKERAAFQKARAEFERAAKRRRAPIGEGATSGETPSGGRWTERRTRLLGSARTGVVDDDPLSRPVVRRPVEPVVRVPVPPPPPPVAPAPPPPVEPPAEAPPEPPPAYSVKSEFDVGHQSSMLLEEDSKFTRIHTYFRVRAELAVEQTGLSLVAAARAGADPEGYGIDPRAIALKYRRGPLLAVVGLQEIAWGETFGLPVVDLVNPRDLRDPLRLDMDWVRVPVVAANVKLVLDDLRLQLVATPFPRNNLLPAPGDSLGFFPASLAALEAREPAGFPISALGRDGEYGGRVSYLMPGGIDLAAYYFRHWSRGPVYRLNRGPTAPVLVPVQRPVNAFGLSFSKAFDQLVLRGDSVLHPSEPWQPTDLWTRPPDVFHLQAVVGGDYTTDDGWIFAMQYHYDRRDDSNLHWGSARMALQFFDQTLGLELFAFVGVGNDDLWIEPKATWQVSDGWWAAAWVDLVQGNRDDRRAGDLGALDGTQRMFAEVRHAF